MSDIETETTGTETTTFEHFGREWTVPIKRQHDHLRRIKAIIRAEGGVDADDVAAVYLSDEDYNALVDLNVAEDELDGFANAIAKAMGVGDKGN